MQRTSAVLPASGKLAPRILNSRCSRQSQASTPSAKHRPLKAAAPRVCPFQAGRRAGRGPQPSATASVHSSQSFSTPWGNHETVHLGTPGLCSSPGLKKQATIPLQSVSLKRARKKRRVRSVTGTESRIRRRSGVLISTTTSPSAQLSGSPRSPVSSPP